jgi:hypothetical protein
MDTSYAVEYARTAGKVVYDSYGSEPEPGGWTFGPDGTLDEEVYHVEITPNGDIFGRHADLSNYLKTAALSGSRKDDEVTLESHHLVPVEVLNQVGISPADGISVAVDSGGHMNDIHGSAGLQTGLVFTDIDQLKNYYREQYASLGAPEWGDKVDEFVEANRDTFTQGLAAVAEELDASKPDPLAEPPPEALTGTGEAIEPDGNSVTGGNVADKI